jgi:hypothetical protein
MKVIWKYEVPDNGVLYMPVGAEILCVHPQGGPVHETVCLWALVDPDIFTQEARRFVVIGTGHPIPNDGLVYRGTAHLRAGTLVLHVFELVKEQA